ncbi:MAG: riboflavin synthase [Leptolyngbya sp. PLA3]|nr:MAG: riboflavin synthase [Cyanobacteria bacterium CYA]MCE7969057.1 riboflavin synthase [Leptolyngbya sp. PL-A3]
MFTGLIHGMGLIRERLDRESVSRLIIDVGDWAEEPRLGDSVAVNGCCLTVADVGPHRELFFDVIPQTLARTTLGRLGSGRKVNIEASATPETVLGGHIVQGHVDGVGTVARVIRQGEYRVVVQVPSELMQYMVPRGSVAVEGVSLTLAEVDPRACTFDIALIPTTLEKTNLSDLEAGDPVNLEADVIAKTVVHYLANYAGRLDRSGVSGPRGG